MGHFLISSTIKGYMKFIEIAFRQLDVLLPRSSYCQTPQVVGASAEAAAVWQGAPRQPRAFGRR
jgi:hypothetical protein